MTYKFWPWSKSSKLLIINYLQNLKIILNFFKKSLQKKVFLCDIMYLTTETIMTRRNQRWASLLEIAQYDLNRSVKQRVKARKVLTKLTKHG